MKLTDLAETIISGPIPQHVISAYVNYVLQHGEQWADAPGGRSVMKAMHEGTDVYGLVDETGNVISIATFEPTQIGSEPFYRLKLISTAHGSGGGFFPQQTLLWTIKEYVGLPIVDYGVQSPHGSRFATALHKSKKFNVQWLNIETGERAAYDDNTIEPRNDTNMTQWRTVIEAAAKPIFPRTITENILSHTIPYEMFDEQQEG